MRGDTTTKWLHRMQYRCLLEFHPKIRHRPHSFPEVIFKWRQPSDNGLKALRQRIDRLKSMGTKIVYTRHDAIPHYCTDKNKLELYRIVETQSNAIIHLGEYSRQEFARIYPENTARHFVIPHHIYDSCGYAFPLKLTSAISWDYRPINSHSHFWELPQRRRAAPRRRCFRASTHVG